VSRFALLREQGTCSLTYTKIIEIPLCERWVPVAEKQGGDRWENKGGLSRDLGVVNATYVLDMVLPCLSAG